MTELTEGITKYIPKDNAKYLVLKTEDLKYLTDRMRNGLATICAEIRKGRISDGKAPSKEYLLVGSDMKCVDACWELMREEILDG